MSKPSAAQQVLHQRRDRYIAECESKLLKTVGYDVHLRDLVVRTLRHRSFEAASVLYDSSLWTLIYESKLCDFIERLDDLSERTAPAVFDLLGSEHAVSFNQSPSPLTSTTTMLASRQRSSIRSRSVACDEPIHSAVESASQLMQAGPEVLVPMPAAQFWSKYFVKADHARAAMNLSYVLEHDQAVSNHPNLDAGSIIQRNQVFQVLQEKARATSIMRHLIPTQ